MAPGKPQSFTVFIARRSGRRFEVQPPGASRFEGLTVMRQLRNLANTDVSRMPEDLLLAQLALRRCLYMLREMISIERRAPEACSLTARSIIETALVGAYLALNEDVADRLLKKQASFSRRLRGRILAGDTTGILAVMAAANFLSDPLDDRLDEVAAAPSFAQIATWLDQRPPFSSTRLASHLYDEAYSFLSNYVEHPTPMSLARHQGVRRHRLSSRRFRPASPVAALTLTHTAMPAVAALASCIASRLGKDPTQLDRMASEAISADGHWWSGSPLRSAAATALFASAGLTRPRADTVGFAMRMLAHRDALRNAPDTEQLVTALEAVEAARSIAALLQMFRWKPIPSHVDLGRWRRVSGEDLVEDPASVVAALLLSYAGLWPADSEGLRLRLAAASAGASAVTPGALDRILATDPPPLREAMRLERLRLNAF
jgi:hypothetical protein